MDVGVRAYRSREPGMEPSEVMTSESQERMLAIVTPDDLEPRCARCASGGRSGPRVIGTVTGTGAPAGPRTAGTAGARRRARGQPPRGRPLYDRPMRARPACDARRRPTRRRPSWRRRLGDAGEDLLALLVRPVLGLPPVRPPAVPQHGRGPGRRRRRAAAQGPGAAADPTAGAGAVSTDGNARWCALDPRAGHGAGRRRVRLNVACAGARPVALVNCLNFGNPEHPEVMWQLSEAIDGMAEACRALGIPVIGGNVSLYNESRGARHRPDPGRRHARPRRPPRARPPRARVAEGSTVVLLSGRPGRGLYRWPVLYGRCTAGGPEAPSGSLPPLDLELHARLLQFVAALVNSAW